jgi:hypothetical protein
MFTFYFYLMFKTKELLNIYVNVIIFIQITDLK